MPSLIDSELLAAAIDALARQRSRGAQRLSLRLARQQEQRERRLAERAASLRPPGFWLRRWLGQSLTHVWGVAAPATGPALSARPTLQSCEQARSSER